MIKAEATSIAKRNHPTKNNTKRAAAQAGGRIFHSCLFCLIRVTPPEWAVDFNAHELEQMVVSHGGQMLSSKWVEALKADQQQQQSAGGRSMLPSRRATPTCYVIGWGSVAPDLHLIHPLVSQVARHKLCHLLHVTPVWLRCCVAEQRSLGPQQFPDVFVPHHLPLHKAFSTTGYYAAVDDEDNKKPKEKNTGIFSKNDAKKDSDSGTPMIRISATGFPSLKRRALAELVEAMGGVYDDSLRTSTTHLICQLPAAGQKYEKAREWKIHTVSEEWLHHVARYGLAGKSGAVDIGCEDRFAVPRDE
jgi:hypothetical protein